ncbi:flagellar basal-body MS-ring/collar protein FliF [Paenibacillus sp. YYML68]|uniref:flagellar basal-body MS-ring/collar protein FliF n=1 Tax=Paenibacillus sp. YYML68 TaxID=2909250 RepID=UPI0024939EDD|nr:flagellar basal-body MS-ring/collar protein FliF [Paenibacillus sp. YYML68]
MNENALQYWERVKQYWNQFSKTQRMTIIATVVLVVLTLGIISYNFSKTEYALAYTNLQPTDAANIKSYLDGAKIPYQLSEDGKSIGVPRSEVASVKLAVESQGLNKTGNIGYGAFNQSSTFGTTDREFDVKYINAVQGELQQLINTNNAIASSKVLISLPKETVFLPKGQEAEKATASVVLEIKPGYQLDQAKVDTMYNLVSHSVKGLPIENITISDSNGEPLEYSKGSNKLNSGNAVREQFEVNNQFRNDVQRNVQQMLGAILGRDKVIVSVFSTMNFDQSRATRNLVTAPNEVDQAGLEISVQEIQKNYTSDGGAAEGGVPGTSESDVPGYPGSSSTGKSNSEELSRTVNYEVNRITEEIVATPYIVKDLTINVGIEPPDPEDENSLTPQTTEAVRQILTNVVRAALADSKVPLTDEELAKKVTVFPHAFAKTNETQGLASNEMLLYGALGGLALALVAGGAFMMVRRRKRAQEEAEEAALMEEAAAAKTEYPTIDIDSVSNENQVRKQLEQLAKKKPEEFVNLLRTWLVDE